jgi:NAD dependent epimerase/dehydratase
MGHESDPMSLKDKTVAVTGADGFIGSHLVEALLSQGCRVRALAFYNSFGTSGWLDSLPLTPRGGYTDLEIISGDIRDPHLMRDFLRGQQIVFHLASLIAIPFSYRSPDSYVDTNVKGTLNLLQAAREAEVERFIHTSTSEVYGSAQRTPMDELHPLSAQSPYAAAKIAADQLALSFHRSYGLPVVMVRPFNTYGPRQSARAIIPTIITQALAHPGHVKLGSLHPVRDFTFVTDTAAGLVAAAKAKKVVGEVINLGTGEAISIGDLATAIGRAMGLRIRVKADKQRVRPEPSEVDRLLCDAAKAQRLLKWRPNVSLEEGLQRTIAWFSDPANLAGYKPDTYTL